MQTFFALSGGFHFDGNGLAATLASASGSLTAGGAAAIDSLAKSVTYDGVESSASADSTISSPSKSSSAWRARARDEEADDGQTDRQTAQLIHLQFAFVDFFHAIAATENLRNRARSRAHSARLAARGATTSWISLFSSMRSSSSSCNDCAKRV